MSDDERAVLRDLAAFVEANGVFPPRDPFVVGQRARMRAFDSLEARGALLRWNPLTVWGVPGLKLIAADVPFAAQELQRARFALDGIQEMYAATLGAAHTVDELRTQLGWGDANEVRRALILLRPHGIFDTFGVWVTGASETFAMSEWVLRLDAASIFQAAEPSVEPTDDSLRSPDDEQQLARAARKLFVEWFAPKYREGRDSPVSPMYGTEEQRRLERRTG